MGIWRETLAYAPSVAALAILLAIASSAAVQGQELLSWRMRLQRVGARPWCLAAAALSVLGAILSTAHPGALVLGLLSFLLSGGACLLAQDPVQGERSPLSLAPGEHAGELGPPWWLGVELLVLVIAAPVLLLPTLRPTLALAAALTLVFSWLLASLIAPGPAGDKRVSSGIWPRSALDLALLLLVGMSILGYMRANALGESASLLALPKAAALLLGLSAFRLVMRVARTFGRRGLVWAVFAFLLLGVALTWLGLLGGLRYTRFPALAPWLGRLPRLLQVVPETQGGRVSLNQLGGMLLLVAPMSLAIALAPFQRALGLWLRPAAAIVGALLIGALVLTQSRGAWAGGVAAFLCLLLLQSRLARRVLVGGLVVGAIGWLLWGRALLGPTISQFATDPKGVATPVGVIGLQGRLQVWTEGLTQVQRAPWLGNGLGAYRLGQAPARPGRTPFDAGLPHAHNVLIQMAYDVGLPGLVAYLALLIVASRSAWRLRHRAFGLPAAIATGALAGLTGYHVYGINDTLALGSKPGVLFWMLLALAMAAESGLEIDRDADASLNCVPSLQEGNGMGQG